MILSLLALIQALPEFLKLLNRLGDVVERFSAWAKENNLNAWIDDLEATIDQLEKAKTPDEKLDAAHSLVGAIRKLK